MKLLKIVLIVIGLLVLAGGGAGAYFELVMKPDMRAVDPAKKFEATPQRLERGKYIVTAETNCLFCHSDHDFKTHGAPELPGMTAGGWDLPFEKPKLPGKIFASNISPDPETGLGAVPDDAVARAIREGIGKDGRALFPMMPWQAFSKYSDEDVASIVAYLRTLAPVKKAWPTSEIIVPVRWMVKSMPKPISAPVAEVDKSDPVKRGRFLAEVGSCIECHTPHNDRHDPLPGMELAGGDEFKGAWGLARAANITPHASGIAHYNEELFIRTMRTGNIGGRRLSPIMPWAGIRNLTDADLKALWAYLKTVKPVAHDVVREPVEVKANPAIEEHPATAAAAPPAEGEQLPAAAPAAAAKPTATP